MTYPFLKGHGTENDFVLLPDHDGVVHGDLDPTRVARLCDRRAGIGGDGVIRVVRSAVLLGRGAVTPEQAGSSVWFMDYRNADGSVSEMCGNGVRVLAHHLVTEGLATTPSPDEPLVLGTRAGVRTVVADPEGGYAVDMGPARLLAPSRVGVSGDHHWDAVGVDMGNPHAVAFVDDLDEAGDLLAQPSYDVGVYPAGVNVEFVVRRGAGHVAMRVHERGSGETRSCGTGACAVLVATALADGAADAADVADGPAAQVRYRIDVPGGVLKGTWEPGGGTTLSGPATIVASGTTDL
ncbi:diaminopimelate epimerase [Nocardioides sp. CFH 31398]|uniref:diaminopimelate epimerase n=1 Tax=Nocardioides sp. CFH 31398 TaxID=2919579 RepID=UPI001F054A60|nr:diaminopimelate epimerase [Nocardioides sp. CFH 31398]MCH1867574.1 diaminopimelate epimerase [Nocardioides sp. CFH 31398]